MPDLHILLLPFMQRALIGGAVVAFTTSLVGIFAVLRKASFFGDSMAHAALAGVAIGMLLGINPILSALILSIIIAIALPMLETQSNLHIDALLGFILPFSMAIGILLISFLPGYQPKLITILFGSILSITTQNLIFIVALAIVTLSLLIIFRAKLLATAFDPVYAKITGISVANFIILHNILLSLAIVPSISLVGIILVTALLTIPAATIKQLTNSLKGLFIFTPILAVTLTLVGIVASVIFSTPTGPTIVVLLGAVFLLVTFSKNRLKTATN